MIRIFIGLALVLLLCSAVTDWQSTALAIHNFFVVLTGGDASCYRSIAGVVC